MIAWNSAHHTCILLYGPCFLFQGHCVLEMPSGTGKTISLLSLLFAYHKVWSGVIAHVNVESCLIYEWRDRLVLLFKLWFPLATLKKLFFKVFECIPQKVNCLIYLMVCWMHCLSRIIQLDCIKNPADTLFDTTGTASHCWSGDILFKNCSRAHQSGGGVEETSQILWTGVWRHCKHTGHGSQLQKESMCASNGNKW